MALAVIMVHVDIERDSEQRIQVALRLADRCGAALVGVAGSEPQPVFAAGNVAIFTERTARTSSAWPLGSITWAKSFASRARCSSTSNGDRAFLRLPICSSVRPGRLISF
jgi:hypothetical protein